jgi:hypothetical protein
MMIRFRPCHSKCKGKLKNEGLNSGQWELKLETRLLFDGGIGTHQK